MPETYRSPHTGSIADLIRQRGTSAAAHQRAVGDARAQQIAASGQAWGNAIGNIAQGVTGTLRDFAQQREQAPRNALIQRQADQLGAELSAMETVQAQKRIGEIAQIIKASGYDPATAEPAFRAIAKLSPDYEQPLMRSLMEPAMLRQVTDTLISQVPGYKAPGTRQIETVVDGVPTIQIVEDAPGQSFAKPPDKVGTRTIQTVENGKPVTKIVPDVPGTFDTAPPVPPPVSLQRAEVLLDGKPTMAVFNPQSGSYSVNGQDVTDRVRPIPPQGPVGGEPLEPIIDPATGEAKLVRRSDAVGARPATTREQPTEDERKTAGFYKRMSDAIRVMEEVEDQISAQDLYQMQSLPQEDLMGALNRSKMSEAAKRYIRAMMQFTEARLRADSGAAVQAYEYVADRQMYGKQYGETPQLSSDRRTARGVAHEGLRTRAGRAIPKDDGKPKDNDPLGIRK